MPSSTNGGSVSDEPTRLETVVAKIFAAQSQVAPLRVSDTATVQLLEGADGQDDCAVFRMSGEQDLVVGSDYVRGPKFRLYEFGLLDEYDLGYYLAAANLSDIAAMGASPIGLLSVVRYPPQMTDAEFASVLLGIKDACRNFGTSNIGGDIGGAERLILSAAALGVCRPGQSLLRRGAKPGDHLFLTGPTGIAGAAMQYLTSDVTLATIDAHFRGRLLAAWKRPQARVREGIYLGNSGLATSCQDTSDGLKAAIESLGDASGVGFRIERECLLIADEVSAVCRHLNLDAVTTVMGDSVDFELLFTVPERHVDTLETTAAKNGFTFSRLGVATAAREFVLCHPDGTTTGLPGSGWRHAPDPP